MEWIESLKEINYFAVVVAVLSGFAVGMAWYSKSMFGKAWMKELGISEKDMDNKDGLGKMMIHSGIAGIFSSVTIAALLIGTGTEGLISGAVFGAVIGFGIAMSASIPHDLFGGVSMKVSQINGLHDIVKFAVVGAILGGWM